MGILDEAIREHLELKRQHGADDSELKQLEDEAFGPPERPGSGEDALSEAPTQFMAQPDQAGDEAPKAGEQRREAAAGILDLQEGPEPTQEDEPSEEGQPAGEHQAVTEPEAVVEEPSAQESSEEPAGHSTEERHAIAEHPTELYDVEGEFSVSAPGAEEPAAEAAVEEEEDDFFSEQRLSEELDQALDAPRDSEPEALETEAPVEELEPEEAPQPDEAPEPDDDEQDFDEEDGELEDEDEQPDFEDEQTELIEEPRPKAGTEEDVLEGTPDFLEQTPEDDELWFEQKPPKDFDFDD